MFISMIPTEFMLSNYSPNFIHQYDVQFRTAAVIMWQQPPSYICCWVTAGQNWKGSSFNSSKKVGLNFQSDKIKKRYHLFDII